MGGGVDAARQARDHHVAHLSQLLGQTAGDALTAGRGDAGADDGDGRPVQQFGPSPRPQDRGRRVQRFQHRGVIGVAQNNQARADLLAGRQFAFDGLGRGRNRGGAGLAGQIGQGGQGAFGRSIAGQKLSEGDGAYSVGAGQPQTGEPLGRGQGHAFLAPMRGSSPFNRRAMF